MMRLILAIITTVLPIASAFAETATDRWTPIDPMMRARSTDSFVIRFPKKPGARDPHGDGINELRQNALGCAEVACQVISVAGKRGRVEQAKIWHGKCQKTLDEAHAGTATWNKRNLARKTSNYRWITEPARGEPEGAGFLCLERREKPEQGPLPAISIAPAVGPGLAGTRLRADNAPRVLGRRPPPKATPPPKAAGPPATRMSDQAEPEVSVPDASQQTWRIIAAGCYSGRADTGFKETTHSGCVRAGLELYLFEGLLISASGESLIDATGVLLGGRGSLAYAVAWFEVGVYGRYLGGVKNNTDFGTATLRDFGPYMAFSVAQNSSVGLVLMLEISAGSRLLRAETDTLTDVSTLAIPAGQLAVQFRFAPF